MIDFERTWWIVVSCIVTTILGYLFADVRSRLQSLRTEREIQTADDAKQVQLFGMALRYILKDRLTTSCEQWLHLGYLPNGHRELITEMRDIYHDLGGNSYISDLTASTLDLPHKKKGGKHGKH